MPTKGQITGATGVYLVASELSKRSFIVSITSRNAEGADILVTDQYCRKAYSVQVKTNASTFSFWLIGKKGVKISSDSHIYVLVNIRKNEIEYYIVPSKIISRKIRCDNNDKWHNVSLDDILQYKDKWEIFRTK